jgi:hypothetical protein
MGATPGTGGGKVMAVDQPDTQVAMVVPPLAGPDIRLKIDPALDGVAGLSKALLPPTRIKDPPLDFGVIWIGVLIGAAIGGLALLWRRYL